MLEVNKKLLSRIFWSICGFIVLYWLLHDAERVRSLKTTLSEVFSPFILGGVLAFILNVPMRFIENTPFKKIKKPVLRRALSVVLTFVFLMLVVTLVVWLLVPQLINTLNALIPALIDFATRVETALRNLLKENPAVLEWLNANTDFETVNWSSLIKEALSGFGNLATSVLGSAVNAISGLFSGAFKAVIGLVFCIYCLFQKETLARQGRKLLYAYCKESFADNVVRVARLTNSTFSNFLSGQCIEVCILGSLFAICMAIFRMPFIPLISVVIAVTAFIPIVGAWTGCILGAFLIFVQDPMLAVWFVVMFLVIQQVENNMIYPRVVGTSVGLSGMWVLVAVSVGGKLMGVAGMFLMIPIASVLYTLCKEAVNHKLKNSAVDAQKLEPQPPELKSPMKVNREKRKLRKLLKLKKDK
ncbi:MAG: AI-2E family transporter [Oscillospiraceae bacterium]|nr:AI-2E family transporter [Oscillospiraceae bacterium]